MSSVLMLIIGGVGAIGVLQYVWVCLQYKKKQRDKKSISDEFIESLKESVDGK